MDRATAPVPVILNPSQRARQAPYAYLQTGNFRLTESGFYRLDGCRFERHCKGELWFSLISPGIDRFIFPGYEAAHCPVKPYAAIGRWYRNLESLPEWQRSAPKN